MNIETAKPGKPLSPDNPHLAEVFGETPTSPEPKDEALESLQKELDSERNNRSEERFYLICALVLLFDVFEFKEMETWAAPMALGILEFALMIALGRKLGVDHIWTITEKILEKWNGRFGK